MEEDKKRTFNVKSKDSEQYPTLFHKLVCLACILKDCSFTLNEDHSIDVTSKTDKSDIEQLFRSAEAPSLRPGLKSQVLATAVEATPPIVPAAVRWGLAASFLVAVGLSIFSESYDRNHRASMMNRPVATPSPLAVELAQEYGLRHIRMQASGGTIGEALMERRREVLKLVKGEENGV